MVQHLNMFFLLDVLFVDIILFTYNSFTVALQSVWNLTSFSLINSCEYISCSKMPLTVSVITASIASQNMDSSSVELSYLTPIL